MNTISLVPQNKMGGNSAVIIPSWIDGRGLCALVVKKFSHGAKEYKYFFPGGKLEPNEDPYVGAERELYAETNQVCGRLEYVTHMYKEERYLKAWFLGLDCSDNPLPQRALDRSIVGKPLWYPLAALFTAKKNESKLHPDHWEALKEALSRMEVFGSHARDILLQNEGTIALSLREGFFSPSI